MRVLLVGGAAREHAIADTLAKAGADVLVIAAHDNPGLAAIAKRYVRGDITDAAAVAALGGRSKVDLAVIGPEAPLAAGVADALRTAGIPVVGPSKDAARIESSKQFCRELLARHGIEASPRFVSVRSPEEVDRAVQGFSGPFVVKPVALTSGKGVLVQGVDFATPEEGAALARRTLAAPNGRDGLLLEEKLVGEEFSQMAFVTDTGIYPMPAVQDYKRAQEADRGANTGGMGSYSQRDHLLPFLSAAHREEALQVLTRTVEALRAEGMEYRGILYGGFMLTAAGPRLVEFNARFGDPEALNVLSLYEPGDFAKLLYGVATGSIDPNLVRFRLRATVAKYVVPMGYGGTAEVGAVIEYDAPAIEDAGVHLFFGTTENVGAGRVRLTSSRGLALVGEASAVWEASERVEAALKFVRGRFYVRHDIGTREDLSARTERMRKLFAPAAKPSPLPLSVAAPEAPPSSAGEPDKLLSA
jgi:phosphoribosylamine--glycine ligase